MKNFIGIIALTILAASCGSDSKEALLKKKYEEFNKLRKEIADLEKELNMNKNGAQGMMGKPVKTSAINYTSFVHSIDIQGRVDAEESVTVGPQMPGLVKRVYVQAGDAVTAGQILAETDADAMTQQLNALKIQRDLAKQIYEKQKNLWEQKIGTEIQYLQTKTQYEAMEKQVAALQEQIGMTKITAPISGTVDAVNMKAGEMAAAGFANIIIVNTSKLRVKGEVAEGYIAKVRTGNDVQVILPDAGKTIDTKITYSGRLINKLNRTFNVEVALNPNEKDVVPNMIAVLKITDYKNDSALVVPIASVQQGADGKKFIYVAVKTADGKTVAERRDVNYERSYDGVCEITEGLRPGDMIITEGYADLNAGDILSVK
ncbi:MAG: efflux RND transporter periplasmic adaptor subunit [Bacteroidia bacterium]